ncbi:hypothetical protein ABI_09680 [Asticcacaulis biprosthecium C19]|uniref:DUF4175 domain-containing protein n=1 Tax=Asticcacaulis biprosthecium C19 TaxID=715226 RepID=F4QGS9_9CAUL|nr:hypothetical protein ABI_09680 [Asticcacaulis biprosthecium C19]
MNRALFWTQVVMVWERILPALFPYVLLVALVAVAAQWGAFVNMPSWIHAGVLSLGLLVAIFASIRAAFRFRLPSFTEYNTRLAVDNGLKPERLLAMRHQVDQPPLKVGKAKAGIAESDPYALRFVALIAAVLGFLVLGPVSLRQVQHGFMPFAQLDAKADMQLAQRSQP